MSAPRTSLLLDQLHRAFDGDPWHGPSVVDVLAGVTVTAATATQAGGVHSIAALVAHMTVWVAEVTRRVKGSPAAEPLEGDWPIPRASDETGWAAMHLELTQAMARLTEAVAEFPEARWADMVGDARDPAPGTGVTFEQTVLGLVQHLAYHAGQIVILRRMLAC